MCGVYAIMNAISQVSPEMAAMVGAAEGKRYAGGHGLCLAPQSMSVMRKIMDDRRGGDA